MSILGGIDYPISGYILMPIKISPDFILALYIDTQAGFGSFYNPLFKNYFDFASSNYIKHEPIKSFPIGSSSHIDIIIGGDSLKAGIYISLKTTFVL